LATVQFLKLGDDNLGVLEISEWCRALKEWLARHGMVFMISLIGFRKLTMRWMHVGLQIVWLGDVAVKV
jgi:hypothetical protein